MAEYGAHLSASALETPSIFEVLAQENLRNGLRNAVRYLVKIFAESRPARYAVLYRCFEEAYTVLDVAVQYSHLKSYGASFSENFYGLKRVPLDPEEGSNSLGQQNSRSLSGDAFYKSLLFLVGVPYLKQRLHDIYERLKEKQLDGTLEQLKPSGREAAKAYLKVYPIIHLLWEGYVFYYQLLYAVGRSDWHSPLLRFASVKLCTLTEDDLASFRRSAYVMLQWQKARGIAAGLGTGLSVGAFFLQFMEWWYSREESPASFAPLPCPPPPEKIQSGASKDKCPLCLDHRCNDTALATTGFVFCYKCIFDYVNKHHKCPVTGYPSSENHLIRIYQHEV